MSDKQFKPAWWLPSPHLQTLWPALCRGNVKGIEIERERFNLPDGDFVDLDWVGRNRTGPLILILHGLEGSIDSHYAKGMLKCIADRGWRAVFMHFRGCSGEPNRLPQAYHSGETGDFDYLIRWILKKQPTTALAAIGFSLGGNVLLKWLGESKENNFLKAAIAISVPFELYKASVRIRKGFSKFYQWYFIRCLQDRLIEKFKNSDECSVDLKDLDKINTMYDFDDKITAPMHGFKGVEEYYRIASSRQYLKNIRIPTLIVHAKDDPFMSQDVIPEPQELSPQVTLEVTPSGGHVGFVMGKYPWAPKYWLEEKVPDFLQSFIR